MKYFIDFEATQYTNEIISIGCIREDGVSFSSLVKPTHKLTKFITALTGITNEMLDEAPEIDEVMRAFDETFHSVAGDIFYSYGKGDVDFILGTIHYSTSIFANVTLYHIKHCLRDFSEEVKSFFGISHNVAMKKVAAFLSGEDIVQKHDAYEDALMLLDIYKGLQTAEKPEQNPFPKPDPKVPSERQKIYRKQRNFKATNVQNGNVQYFVSIAEAAAFRMRNDKTANEKTRARIVGRINSAIENGTTYNNCHWEKLDLC